jgi:hypothetical protein
MMTGNDKFHVTQITPNNYLFRNRATQDVGLEVNDICVCVCVSAHTHTHTVAQIFQKSRTLPKI